MTNTHDVPEAFLACKDMYEDKIKNNIENFIGLAKVPVGLAGPLLIHGEHAEGEFYVPLATTEGTQVASASRGMKVLKNAGGVHACMIADRGIQRAPVFELSSIQAAKEFAHQVVKESSDLIPHIEETTRIGKFHSLAPLVMGRFVHLRMTITSGDAAGQNMVSVAVQNACSRLAAKYPEIVRYWLDAGMSGEKMPSQVNILMGRGKQVTCSAAIPDNVLYEITRARAEDIVLWFSLYANTASAIGWKGVAGTTGNTMAALFIATGQDVGSVAESSIGYTLVEHDQENGVLRWEMTFPNLVVGTYGGGTHLPTQRAALEMLGCYGAGRVAKFCELAAATAMAAEISLIAALCSGEWVDAHDKMGRNRY